MYVTATCHVARHLRRFSLRISDGEALLSCRHLAHGPVASPCHHSRQPCITARSQVQNSTWWALLVAAVVAYVFYGRAGASSGDGTTIDGLSFEASVKMGGVSQQLTGGGTRTKYGVAKVYAVALYLDAAGGESALKKFGGKSASSLKGQAAFYSALIDGAFARTLALKFHRSVSSDAMVNALDEAMAKRLPSEATRKFRESLFKALGAGAIAKGAEVYFMCRAGTLMIGSGAPSAGATLREKGVCSALFDVYYGKQPVSAAAKEGAASGFASRGFFQ